MIIEVTGVPGVGKSTLLKMLNLSASQKTEIFNNRHLIKRLSESTWLPLSRTPLFVQRILGEFYLYCICLRKIWQYASYLKFILRRLKILPEPLIFKINIFRNILLKIARFEFAAMQQQTSLVLIFDEGVSHIPYNLVDHTSSDALTTLAAITPLRNILNNVVCIHLVADESEVRQRLEARGHKRLSSSNRRYTVDAFASKNSSLSREYEKEGPTIFANYHRVSVTTINKSSEAFQMTVEQAAKFCGKHTSQSLKDTEIGR